MKHEQTCWAFSRAREWLSKLLKACSLSLSVNVALGRGVPRERSTASGLEWWLLLLLLLLLLLILWLAFKEDNNGGEEEPLGFLEPWPKPAEGAGRAPFEDRNKPAKRLPGTAEMGVPILAKLWLDPDTGRVMLPIGAGTDEDPL